MISVLRMTSTEAAGALAVDPSPPESITPSWPPTVASKSKDDPGAAVLSSAKSRAKFTPVLATRLVG